jgi:hypothetical protein
MLRKKIVHVDPVRGTTIVKLSANRKYGIMTTEATDHDEADLEFCVRDQVIARTPKASCTTHGSPTSALGGQQASETHLAWCMYDAARVF